MDELPNLSRVTPVAVRDVWPHETHQFTQWLLANADVRSEDDLAAWFIEPFARFRTATQSVRRELDGL